MEIKIISDTEIWFKQQRKVILEIIFDSQGSLHHGFSMQAQTVNKEIYTDILCYIHDAIRRKCPEKGKTLVLLLHNLPIYQSTLVKE